MHGGRLSTSSMTWSSASSVLQSSLGSPFGSRSVPSNELGEYARQFLAAAIVHDVGECVPVEGIEESIERFPKHSFQPADRRNHAGVGLAIETLDQPHVGFG